MTTTTDYDHILTAMEYDAVRHARALTIARIDSGMDPVEARASVRRWGQRLASHVMHGVDAGVRSAQPEIGGDE